MFLDYSYILSFGALINFLLGARGYGKSYGAKKLVIKDFLKDGSQFIYLRRRDSELKEVTFSLFNDINLNNEFEKPVIYDSDGFLYDGKQCGYCMALSKAADYKSSSYPEVKTIIFDEVLTDKKPGYLLNEPERLLDFMETIFRMRDNVRIFMLSNSISLNNPYVIKWDLYVPKGKNYLFKDDVLFMLLESKEYSAAKAMTRLGRLYNALDKDFAAYAVENAFLFDDQSFIEKKSGQCNYKFTFIWKGKKYGVWHNYKTGLVYISTDINTTYPLELALSGDDHSENLMLLRGKKGNIFDSVVFESYKMGCLRFENKKIRNETLDIFKRMV